MIRAYRDFMEKADDDIGGGVVLVCAPPEDFVPEPMHGMPVVAIIVAWAWLGESLRPVQLSGAALTLLGIGLAQTAR